MIWFWILPYLQAYLEAAPPQITQFFLRPWWPLAIDGLAGLIVFLIVFNALRAWARARYQGSAAFQKHVLMVTVPKEQAEKGEAGMQEKTLQQIQEKIALMENVFVSIGGLKAQRGLKAWFVGREDAVAFEMVLDRGLVTFYVAAPPHLKGMVTQQIQAQLPSAQVDEVPDYNIFSPRGAIVGTRLGYKRNHYLPIKTYKKLETDPLNSLTNALAKVDKQDGAAIQLIVRSAKAGWRSPARSLVRHMQQGKTYYEAMRAGSFFASFKDTFASSMKSKPKDGEPKKEYRMSPAEEELIKTLDEKISKFGLDVTIRVVASAKDRATADLYLSNIVGSFSQFNIPQYGNQLTRFGDPHKRLVNDFIYRHFSDANRVVMTGEELASIYHLPLASTETPNVRWLTARKIAPPTNIPKEGLYLGYVDYQGERTNIHLKKEDRFRHVYMIGKSGVGKSEVIANMAIQDIKNGDGVAVVDPHGDLVETILSCIPKERADDVIIFDPSDMDRPVGLNMLESPSEEMRDFVVAEMIAIFYKLFPPEYLGPMFEHTMRNLMLTLTADFENPGTLIEIPRLVTDPAYQKEWLSKVTDPVVRSYWENEVARTSDFHKSEMFGYLVSKVGRFVENSMMRNIIGQQHSPIDFRKVMDDRKILLVNLSKGKIGDINAQLLGLVIVTKLQMAVMKRADTSKEERRDFFLYIDEFQNFITPSIATILSEARKYRISLTIAHQYMAQLAPKGDAEIRDAVLGNVGTMLIGRIGIEDAEVLAKEFAPVFAPLDLVNVDKFHWNAKLLVDNTASRPFTFAGPLPMKGDRRMFEALKQLSRLKFGRDRLIVEDEIMERAQLGGVGAKQ